MHTSVTSEGCGLAVSECVGLEAPVEMCEGGEVAEEMATTEDGGGIGGEGGRRRGWSESGEGSIISLVIGRGEEGGRKEGVMRL